MAKKAIKVEGLSKKYDIGANLHGTLRDSLQSLFSRTHKEEFYALKNISFNLDQGDALGIIGSNGAGKSTLLKLLSKITYPSSGSIELNGRLTSLLEIGTGFHPELTGRENIYLNGSLLGMSRSEIKDKFDEIVDFSGVEKFIDTPVKHFSSGMYTRLAFSVAAHLNTEILLVDEVLAVGDLEFQKKCLGKMDTLNKNGRTVVLVSHNHTYLDKLCNKFMKIEKGIIVAEGDTLHDIHKYNISGALSWASKNGVISEIIVKPTQQNEFIRSGEDLKIEMQNMPFEGTDFQILRLEIFDSFGGVNLILNNRLIDKKCDLRAGVKTTITIESLPLHQGIYGINIILKDQIAEVDRLIEPFYFRVEANPNVKLAKSKSQSFAKYVYQI